MVEAYEDVRKQLDVSRETFDRLAAYELLVRKWNPAINLVAVSTLGDIWDRHILDSVRVFDHAPRSTERWVDLGSGGGFPGAVAAILATEKAPGLRVTCIESDIRKCEFLRTVSRVTGASIAVMSRRIEEAPPQQADVVSARALGALSKLLGFADRHLRPDGTALFLKGETWQNEVADAHKTWTFDLEAIPNPAQTGAALLKLRNIARA